MRGQGCFGGANDQAEVTQQVTQLIGGLDQNPASGATLDESRATLLEALRILDARNSQHLAGGSAGWDALSRELSRQINLVAFELQQDDATIPAALWMPGNPHGFFETASLDYLIDYTPLVARDCRDSDLTTACADTLARVGDLTRLMALGFNVLNQPVRTQIAEINAAVSRLDAEWDYYFDEARSQYSWELLVNNMIYDPPGDVLAGPPNAQLILFHPTIALEYVGSGPQNEAAYDTVGMVELVGYNSWRGSMPLGASIVATYTPETTGDRVGLGVMLHIQHNYSIGVTRRDTGLGDETTWLFSVDLTKLFLSKSQQIREEFRLGEAAQ